MALKDKHVVRLTADDRRELECMARSGKHPARTWVHARMTLRAEVAAWEADRNAAAVRVDWQFTTADARVRLTRLYPMLEPATSAVAEH